jgi:hypothetical protein
MKKSILMLFVGVMLSLSAVAQNYRIYYATPDQIRVDNAAGVLQKISPAADLKIKAVGTKVGFTFSGFGLTLSPSQVRKVDSTAYGATVADVISAFVVSSAAATDQVIVNSTSTGTLTASTYSYVELHNDHATVASSIVVGGNTISIPSGKSVIFQAIRSPKTGGYKPIPAIAYTATSSSLRIYTIKE